MAFIDFTLSNTRRFYSSMGNPLGWKGLMAYNLYNLFFLIAFCLAFKLVVSKSVFFPFLSGGSSPKTLQP